MTIGWKKTGNSEGVAKRQVKRGCKTTGLRLHDYRQGATKLQAILWNWKNRQKGVEKGGAGSVHSVQGLAVTCRERSGGVSCAIVCLKKNQKSFIKFNFKGILN